MTKPRTPSAAALKAAPAPAITADAAPTLPSPPDGDDGDRDEIEIYPPAMPYDPEEYRWVPVRRKPRTDGWTEEKLRRFIEVLADTGLVSEAAKTVGMTREGAYKLRRSAHGAAFARAWEAARLHAGSFLEDVAFERAVEGVEHNVFNEYGEVICTKRVYNDRLLTFLLRHLKPERYARDALAQPSLQPAVTVEASLRELEPQLPAPAGELLDADTLNHELHLADVADGELPHFLREQRPVKSAERLKQEERVAQDARGKEALDRICDKKIGETGNVTHQDMIDITRYLDPASRNEPPRKRFR